MTQLQNKALELGRDWLEAPSDDDAENDKRRTAFLNAMGAYLEVLGWTAPRRKKLRASP